ncbi:Ig-like domain-containing protein [Cecembia rubra]|uniref:Ig-like domain-containing protein n=1 Tax=Cecembia rubra TaxID=1485585 RepID=UPI000D0D3F7D|nr:Ig-like domain-containing protein [Cecembia rubra]
MKKKLNKNYEFLIRDYKGSLINVLIMKSKRKKIYLLTLAISSLLFGIVDAATYHFSTTDGDDNRSSAQAQSPNTPWKSIEKLNSVFPMLQPGDQVLFKSGDVFYGEIRITRSGTSGAPIVFGSYGSGNKPLITGLVRPTDWVSVGSNLFETRLLIAQSSLNVVIIDGIIRAMGRFPNPDANNKGYLTINSVNQGTVSSSELNSPTNLNGGEVVIRKNNWIIDRHPITNHSGNSITYNTTGSNYNPAVGFGFFIQNHPGTLDQHGEWFYNVGENRLRIFYDKGSPNNKVEISQVTDLISLQSNISNITFRNLNLSGANRNIISIQNSANIVFENCVLENIGDLAIRSVGSNNLTIDRTVIQNVHNGGVFQQWNDTKLKISNSSFINIFNFPGMGKNGDLHGMGVYMSETASDGLIENSNFTNCGYIPINFSGNNTIVRNNYIDTFNNVKDDGAGIYTYTGRINTNYTNRKVINNIIINGIGAREGTRPYGPNDPPYVEGIYMDDNASGVEISGNTIANIASSGIFIHNARNITITKNNIYNTAYSLKFSHDNLGDPIRNISVTGNSFLQKSETQLHLYAVSRLNDINQIGTFDNNVYSKPINEKNNFLISIPQGRRSLDLTDWQNDFGFDKNSKRSPISLPEPKIIDVKGENKINNGNFSTNQNNSSCWSSAGGCIASIIDNSSLDGRALRVDKPNPSILMINVGSIEKGKSYRFKFSIIGNNGSSLIAFIRENQTPWSRISNERSISITNQRQEIEFVFTATETRNNAVLILESRANGTSYQLDNLVLEEVTIEAIKIDDFLFFDYNRNSSPKSINLPGNYVDLNGTEVGSSVSIPSFYSVLLLKKNGEVPQETLSPSVKITNPCPNATFSTTGNITVNIEASSPNGKIEKVELFRNSVLALSSSGSPSIYSFTIGNLQEGPLELMARATDEKGIVGESSIVRVNIVKPNILPNVQIINPTNGDSFEKGKMILIEAVASDEDGEVTKVDFFWGNNLIGTADQAPFVTSFTPQNVGNFFLTAVAYDNKGDSNKSSAISITINDEITLPKIFFVTPENDQEFAEGSNILISVAFDGSDESIDRIEYYNGSQLIGSSNSKPFSFDWKNVAPGVYSLKARAIGKDPNKTNESETIQIRVIAEGQNTFRIVSPERNSVLPAGFDLPIKVHIPISSKIIRTIEYYRGNTLIGRVNTAPYIFIWKNIPQGEFNLVARIVYEDNSTLLSNILGVNIVNNRIPSVRVNYDILESESENKNPDISFTVNYENVATIVEKVEFFANGKSIGLSKSEPFDFLWESVEPGTYNIKVVITDKFGIEYISGVESILIKNVLDEKEAFSLRIGPNPTNNQLIIFFLNSKSDNFYEIKIISMNGLIMKELKENSIDSAIALDVSFLIRGTYIVQVTDGYKILVSEKFIKN